MSRGEGPRRIVLVRHAPAARRDPARWPGDDPRPLKPTGRREFTRAAAGLARMLSVRGTAASSPLTRARQTAQILGQRWGPARKAETWEELRPEGAVDALLERLREEVRPERDLVLFGHEPQFSRFVGFALTGEALGAVKCSKGGAVALRFTGPPRAGGGQLLWALTRRQLMAMGRADRDRDDAD